jgi:hypothetical protein
MPTGRERRRTGEERRRLRENGLRSEKLTLESTISSRGGGPGENQRRWVVVHSCVGRTGRSMGSGDEYYSVPRVLYNITLSLSIYIGFRV